MAFISDDEDPMHRDSTFDENQPVGRICCAAIPGNTHHNKGPHLEQRCPALQKGRRRAREHRQGHPDCNCRRRHRRNDIGSISHGSWISQHRYLRVDEFERVGSGYQHTTPCSPRINRAWSWRGARKNGYSDQRNIVLSQEWTIHLRRAPRNGRRLPLASVFNPSRKAARVAISECPIEAGKGANPCGSQSYQLWFQRGRWSMGTVPSERWQ
mmetsp:Transcript_36893/g.62768  ORF Transcript_36893/g.62768 Transcript_36893/m.62768 type:complete len:212 (+) Transcript_36893:109-744(+)